MITFSIFYYLYDEIGNLRIEAKFRINENRFNEAKEWIEQSIQPSTDEDYWIISLPQKYKSLAEDGKVSVKYEYGVVIIQFYRGGGLFEYGPSFVYRSDNISPPFESFGDIVCTKTP
ncbi:MAG: hypothetical protein UZ14_CFX002002672 [Chloroflexi bacterium OLB14]|nr:MAG: hypothetical protein UZ14_CFX002002672 [Chloroflexi bacterium OLB14]